VACQENIQCQEDEVFKKKIAPTTLHRGRKRLTIFNFANPFVLCSTVRRALIFVTHKEKNNILKFLSVISSILYYSSGSLEVVLCTTNAI
jgi:hypothetical protein